MFVSRTDIQAKSTILDNTPAEKLLKCYLHHFHVNLLDECINHSANFHFESGNLPSNLESNDVNVENYLLLNR